MVLKFVYKRAGNHTHFRMWVGRTLGSLALAGKLAMTNEEFEDLRDTLQRGNRLNNDIIFEEQVISYPATRGNNDYRQA